MDLLNLNTFAENILYFYRLLDEENKICLPKTIKHSFISVFDRTTNREEFEKLCYTFSMLKAHINDPKYEDKWSLYYSYEEKFKKFYKNLFKYEVYKLNSTSQGVGWTLEYLSSEENYEKKFISNIREDSINFGLFFVKELNLAVNGGFDHTHELFMSSDCDIKGLEKLAAESGLFILE